MDYAYTGNVELTVGNAERIYFLAHNLERKQLMAYGVWPSRPTAQNSLAIAYLYYLLTFPDY